LRGRFWAEEGEGEGGRKGRCAGGGGEEGSGETRRWRGRGRGREIFFCGRGEDVGWMVDERELGTGSRQEPCFEGREAEC